MLPILLQAASRLVPAPLLLAAEGTTVAGVEAATILLATEASLTAETLVEASEAALALALAGLTIAVAGDVDGAGLALVGVEEVVEGHGLPVVQRLVAVGVDGREVDEDILATIGGRDEAESLVGVEELDGTGAGHFCDLEEGGN